MNPARPRSPPVTGGSSPESGNDASRSASEFLFDRATHAPGGPFFTRSFFPTSATQAIGTSSTWPVRGAVRGAYFSYSFCVVESLLVKPGVFNLRVVAFLRT